MDSWTFLQTSHTHWLSFFVNFAVLCSVCDLDAVCLICVFYRTMISWRKRATSWRRSGTLRTTSSGYHQANWAETSNCQHHLTVPHFATTAWTLCKCTQCPAVFICLQNGSKQFSIVLIKMNIWWSKFVENVCHVHVQMHFMIFSLRFMHRVCLYVWVRVLSAYKHWAVTSARP